MHRHLRKQEKPYAKIFVLLSCAGVPAEPSVAAGSHGRGLGHFLAGAVYLLDHGGPEQISSVGGVYGKPVYRLVAGVCVHTSGNGSSSSLANVFKIDFKLFHSSSVVISLDE